MCRAWDEGNNTQPRDLTWNLMGMGNNPWFRIKTHVSPKGPGGERWVQCEHPTEPASKPGGWMGSTAGAWNLRVDSMTTLPRRREIDAHPREPQERRPRRLADGAPVEEAAAAPASAGYAPPPGATLISLAEVEKHDTEDDCWIVVKGKVYDVNKYLAEGLHPGGNASITMNAGVDSTEDFEAVHSAKAWKQLEEYAIDYLDPKDDPNAAAANHASTAQVTLTAAPIKSEARAPHATGPVNLPQYALDHPEMYGDTLVGERAEAAAFDRMWAGARAACRRTRPSRSTPRSGSRWRWTRRCPCRTTPSCSA